MDLIEFERRIEQAALDERIDQKIAAAKRQLAIWMVAVAALAVVVSLLLARLIWDWRP